MYTEFYDMMQRQNWVVLDTETTGLDRPAEICSIAIVDHRGATLLDCLIRTKLPIPPVATAIHGITDDMVAEAPTWPEIRPTVLSLIKGLDVVVYNAVYDRKLMHWSDEAWNAEERTDYKADATWWCAMEMYAAHHGERHPYYGSYVWQKLSAACLQMDVPFSDQHTALGDSLATRELIMRCWFKESIR